MDDMIGMAVYAILAVGGLVLARKTMNDLAENSVKTRIREAQIKREAYEEGYKNGMKDITELYEMAKKVI